MDTGGEGGCDLMDDNIIQLDVIRIDRNKPRKCTCKHPKFTLDTKNREVTCGCGMVHDPFEAMLNLAGRHEELNRQQRSLNDQRTQWLKEKPHSVIFKGLERSYRKGTMLPFCPSCGDMIDFKDMMSFGNAEFYRKLKAKSKGDDS